MKIKFLNFFLVLFLCSCIISDNDYEIQLAKMPKGLVSHFPQKLDNLSCSFIQNTDTTSKCIYLMLYVKNQDIANLKIEDYKAKYEGSDTTLITVKRATVTYWDPSKAVNYKTLEVNNNAKLYPVPYFESEELYLDKKKNPNIFSAGTKSGLSKDFIIYVYDYKPGIFWEGLKPLDYMPKECKNGYSKGVAVNSTKGMVIYWMVIW